jgi:hypothetical protein
VLRRNRHIGDLPVPSQLRQQITDAVLCRGIKHKIDPIKHAIESRPIGLLINVPDSPEMSKFGMDFSPRPVARDDCVDDTDLWSTCERHAYGPSGNGRGIEKVAVQHSKICKSVTSKFKRGWTAQ